MVQRQKTPEELGENGGCAMFGRNRKQWSAALCVGGVQQGAVAMVGGCWGGVLVRWQRSSGGMVTRPNRQVRATNVGKMFVSGVVGRIGSVFGTTVETCR